MTQNFSTAFKKIVWGGGAMRFKTFNLKYGVAKSSM